jgi:O-methyltransferase involved in polyketide biosynthesis
MAAAAAGRTTVYEVDHREVRADKMAVLRETAPASKRRSVPGDLATDWVRELLAAGFDPTRATVWIAAPGSTTEVFAGGREGF